MKPKYTVYGVDRAGVPWECRQTDNGPEVLSLLTALRAEHSPRHRAYGVFLTDDPEVGDVEDQIEEAHYVLCVMELERDLMTSKRFEALADALAKIRPNSDNGTYWYEEWYRAVEAVADVGQMHTAHFRRERFIDACRTR